MYWLLSNALRSLIKTTVQTIIKSYGVERTMVKNNFNAYDATFYIVLSVILYHKQRRDMRLGLKNRTRKSTNKMH